MDILLIGQADSIFFEHYCKSLKTKKPNINIDVFSVDLIEGKYDLSTCNIIGVNNWQKTLFSKIKGIRTIIKPFYTWLSLYCCLNNANKKYDIFHFKWLIPGVIILPNLITKYCKYSIATFWGGEIENQHLIYSNLLYLTFLKRFFKKMDVITYANEEIYNNIIKIYNNETILVKAIYGSEIYKEIERLGNLESKKESKKALGINQEKITISIGYSGKSIHQHIKIINILFANAEFKKNIDKFIFIIPMNYGCNIAYINKVESLIKLYNAQYILLTQKMNNDQIARLRNATDIMIQMSISDARSASIIESILAGSILITGSWLPYEEFKEKNIYFHELYKIDSSLPELILKISSNIDDQLRECQNNKMKWGNESWEKVINNWIDIYDKFTKILPEIISN